MGVHLFFLLLLPVTLSRAYVLEHAEPFLVANLNWQPLAKLNLTAAQAAAYAELGPLYKLAGCSIATGKCLDAFLEFLPDEPVLPLTGKSDAFQVSNPVNVMWWQEFWAFSTLQWFIMILCALRWNKKPVLQNSAPLMILTEACVNINFWTGHGASAWSLAWPCNETLITQFTVPLSIYTVCCMIYRYSFMYRRALAKVPGSPEYGQAEWFVEYRWLIGWQGFVGWGLVFHLPCLIYIGYLYHTYYYFYQPGTTIGGSGRGLWWYLDTPDVNAYLASIGQSGPALFPRWPHSPHYASMKFCSISASDKYVGQVLQLLACYTLVPMAIWYLWRPQLAWKYRTGNWKKDIFRFAVNDLYGIKYMVLGMGGPATITMPVFNTNTVTIAQLFWYRFLIFITEIPPTLGIFIPTLLSFVRDKPASRESSLHTWDTKTQIRTPSVVVESESTQTFIASIIEPLVVVSTKPQYGAITIGNRWWHCCFRREKQDIALTLNAFVDRTQSDGLHRFHMQTTHTADEYRMIFANPSGYEAAKKCLTQLFSTELMVYLQHSHEFYVLCASLQFEQACEKGFYICNTFIANNSPSQINVSAEMQQALLSLFPDYARHTGTSVQPVQPRTGIEKILHDLLPPIHRILYNDVTTQLVPEEPIGEDIKNQIKFHDACAALRRIDNEIANLLRTNFLKKFIDNFLPDLIRNLQKNPRHQVKKTTTSPIIMVAPPRQISVNIVA